MDVKFGCKVEGKKWSKGREGASGGGVRSEEWKKKRREPEGVACGGKKKWRSRSGRL